MSEARLDKDKIFEPYYQITTARELMLFTFRICDMLKNGEIDEKLFNKKVIIDNVLKIDCQWKSSFYSDFAHNLKLCVIGNCFIVIDEALNGIFGDKPKNYLDNDIDALRAIIYMLRCAISHGPVAPRWEAKDKYCRNFKIKEIGYELDVKKLNGQILKHRDYGGLKGAISLIDYSLTIVKRHSSDKQVVHY